MEDYRIIIAGSRGFNDYELLKNKVSSLIIKKFETHKIIIVSGTARGADLLGEDFAKEFDLEINRFPADWDKYGKKAGYIRNEEMAKVADALIVFWDGVSKGTKHMIELGIKYNLNIRIIEYGK